MPASEGKTQVEVDKISIDPDIDFREIARRSYEDLSSNEMGMFKWSGVYQQLQKGFFMIRLRVPGGLFTAPQLRRAAELAAQYGQDELCITTRQCLQFHWIRQSDIYKILEEMEKVGVLTQNACGDVTRNVITCPLAGVCPHEEGDTLGMLQRIADDDELLYEQRNLPRKHKISVAGCGRACGQTLMNCQGWHPVSKGSTAWKFHAGGGLGARPFMGQPIFDSVPEHLVVPVTQAVAEAFRRHGDRRVRAFARLKYVIHRMGRDGFRDVVLGILKERNISGLEELEYSQGEAEIGQSFLDGQAVIPQKQAGMNTVRVIIPRSELKSKDARSFADCCERFGDGSLIFTNRQNLQLRYVPDAKVKQLVAELEAAGYALDGHERVPDAVACVGTTQCNLAVSDTPSTYRRLMSELSGDKEWWEKIGPLRINMNGCPNSCGQHAIADIGLRGLRKRTDEGSDEGYSVCVGGSLAGKGHIVEYVCDVSLNDVVPLVRKMLEVYLEQRESSSETFGDFARKLTGPGMRDALGRREADDAPLNQRNIALSELFSQTFDYAKSL